MPERSVPTPSAPTDETVRALLAAARLPATESEIAATAAGYPALRSTVDALYAQPAARYVDPALRFRADAVGPETDWYGGA